MGKPVTAHRVPGGIILDGTKSFVTNSGDGGIANVGLAIEGEGRFHALVELSDATANQRHDWDNMGQRGTQSQTIDFDGVKVSDGWFFPAHRPDLGFIARAFLQHSALIQGIGEGAYIAMLEFVKSMKRGMQPGVASPAEDALIKRRIGELASALAASGALLLQSASRVEHDPDSEPAALASEAMKTKYACIESSLKVGSDLFDLTGARSTANSYRFDRFWRNTRTFATHDPFDLKAVMVGEFELTGNINFG